ncbi:unnamed protein product [Arabidopsis halleri]
METLKWFSEFSKGETERRQVRVLQELSQGCSLRECESVVYQA